MVLQISSPLALAFGALITLLSFIGIMGNIAVICAILGDKNMRQSVINFLLMNLSIADLLFITAHLAVWLPKFVTGTGIWALPNFLCPTTDLAIHMAIYVSILTYMTISVERYVAIVHPMRMRGLGSRRKSTLLVVVAIWSLVVVWWVPSAIMTQTQLVRLRDVNDTVVSICALQSTILFASAKNYDIYNWFIRGSVWGTYALAVLSSIVLYWRICRVLWARNSFIHGNSIDLKNRKDIVKMLIVCVIIFFICYTGMLTIMILTTLRVKLPTIVKVILPLINMGMSVSNPFIYTIFSAKFRRRMAEMLPSCCRRFISEAKEERVTTSATAENNAASTVLSKLSDANQPKLTRWKPRESVAPAK